MSSRAEKAALTIPENPIELPPSGAEDTLTTPQKLLVLIEDGRAGFVPSTHREKNQAVCVLDYIDNPQYRGGVHDYLAEIYSHNKKIKGSPITGSFAVRSVLFEFADYTAAAISDISKLKKFESVLQDTPNPRLSLAEAAADHGQPTDIIVPFIKYVDVRDVANDVFTGPHDPLTTKESRQPQGSGRNKTVHDTYDSDHQDLFISGYLALRAETLTVGESRDLVPIALLSQQKRQSFWGNVLSSRMYEYQRFADEVLETLPE